MPEHDLGRCRPNRRAQVIIENTRTSIGQFHPLGSGEYTSGIDETQDIG